MLPKRRRIKIGRPSRYKTTPDETVFKYSDNIQPSLRPTFCPFCNRFITQRRNLKHHIKNCKFKPVELRDPDHIKSIANDVKDFDNI